MRKGRCPLNPAPPGALAGAWPPGGPGRGLGTAQQRNFVAEHFSRLATKRPTRRPTSRLRGLLRTVRGAERFKIKGGGPPARAKSPISSLRKVLVEFASGKSSGQEAPRTPSSGALES